MKPALLALAAASILAAPAVAATPTAPAIAASPDQSLPPHACFRPGDIVSHALGGDGHSIYVLVSGRGTYKLEMQGACLQGAVRTDPIAFRQPIGFARACKPSDLFITINKGGPRPCFAQSIALLSREEVQALPKDWRP
jgi:hypothetical protein